jgi:hypothetical protein
VENASLVQQDENGRKEASENIQGRVVKKERTEERGASVIVPEQEKSVEYGRRRNQIIYNFII